MAFSARNPYVLALAAGVVAAIAILLYVAVGGGPSSASPPVKTSVAEESDRTNPSTPAELLFATTPEDGLGEFEQTIHPERVFVVDDPAGSRRKVLRFDVRSSDTGPTENPRAQLETPADFNVGDDRYAGFAYYFPDDFPSELPPQAWIALGSVAYGPPFDGAGPISIRVQNNVDDGRAELRWQRNDTYDNDIPWVGPKLEEVKGRWVRFVVRAKLSRDSERGFVELWMDSGSGWKKQPLDGKDRLHMITYDASNDGGPNSSRLALYYRQDIEGPLAMYHGGLTIASAGRGAFAKVAPPLGTSSPDGEGR